MKVKYLLACLMGMCIVACTDDPKTDGIPETPVQTRAVTLDAGDIADGVEVYIFRQDDNGFMHLSSINSGWVNGKTTVNLQNGDYKFLFHKSERLSCDIFPAEMTPEAAFDVVKWDCRDDMVNGEGYAMPVDEIWLPETYEMANAPYSIQAAALISNRLTRAVSQVMVHLRKGTPDNPVTRASDITPIAVNLGTMDIHINGVGRSLNVIGGSGTANTRVSVVEAMSEGDDVITFTGPFVFPSDSGTDATVTITYTPNENSEIPAFSKTVNGPLERNRKLEISVWLGDEPTPPIDEGNLEVTVDVKEMEDNTDSGDNGRWE